VGAHWQDCAARRPASSTNDHDPGTYTITYCWTCPHDPVYPVAQAVYESLAAKAIVKPMGAEADAAKPMGAEADAAKSMGRWKSMGS